MRRSTFATGNARAWTAPQVTASRMIPSKRPVQGPFGNQDGPGSGTAAHR